MLKRYEYTKSIAKISIYFNKYSPVTLKYKSMRHLTLCTLQRKRTTYSLIMHIAGFWLK